MKWKRFAAVVFKILITKLFFGLGSLPISWPSKNVMKNTPCPNAVVDRRHYSTGETECKHQIKHFVNKLNEIKELMIIKASTK